MSPNEFAKLFAAVATEHEVALSQVAGTRAGLYTAWFSNTVVPAVTHLSGLHLHCESYPSRIDYVLSQDTEWPHRLDIAIEHEKAGATAEQEVAKLALVNSRLAVLVTYIMPLAVEAFLSRYRNIISHLGLLDVFGKERGFLLILGEHDPWKPITPRNSVAWNIFSLENSEWKRLEVFPRPQATSEGLLISGEGECPNCGQLRPRLNYMDLLECSQCHAVYANVDGVVATVMPFLGQGEFREGNETTPSLAGTAFAKSNDGGVLPDLGTLFKSREELACYVATLTR